MGSIASCACGTDVIMKIVNRLRDEMKDKLVEKIAWMVGGIPFDGVKVEDTGHKYYEFVLHYI